ncbi:ribonuclease P protein component [Aliiroseovarius crassostreae]|uniref:ribonuclease P protein component n=1 Tax=Aliiroseovarius crassostreae TaxID=154981 RepID=UPI0021AFF707|nr:ribonuclease P protein component [Aliiroseovarius crassostreae]UWP92560.1 ribonuclease P protein component [Aliiroseovarius crassostreae]UWP98871.1 ribonuclease P protein component [Aliiroseovarius crassostreae]
MLTTLTQRRDFLSAARARRAPQPAFLLQARRRRDDEPAGEDPRIGYTCSKKVGNAVARNRAKRRLRAIAREVLPTHGKPGWDYVLIGRKDATATRPYNDLVEDLIRALKEVHTPRAPRPKPKPKPKKLEN